MRGLLQKRAGVFLMLTMCLSATAMMMAFNIHAEETAAENKETTIDIVTTDIQKQTTEWKNQETTKHKGEVTTKSKPVKKTKLKKKAPKLKKPKASIDKSIEHEVKITWKKVSKAKKYYVYRATNKKGKYTLVYKSSKKTYKDKTAKPRHTYYYKVRAAVTFNKKIVYSKYSKVKSVYVKSKEPTAVIAGECFADGLKEWAKEQCPKGTKFVTKIGISTYGFMNTNNFKYRGDTVTGLERVALYNPDTVFFLLGMNEAIDGRIENTISNFKTMIKKLKKVNPDIDVVLLPLSPTTKTSTEDVPTKAQRLKLNNAYKKLAGSTKNVYYYDYTSMFDDGNGYMKKSCDGGDGCHWSYNATVLMAEKLTKWAKNTLDK